MKIDESMSLYYLDIEKKLTNFNTPKELIHSQSSDSLTEYEQMLPVVIWVQYCYCLISVLSNQTNSTETIMKGEGPS